LYINILGVIFIMIAFMIFVHVIVCLALILIVLIQTSKGGLDSNFGGVATNMFGSQGANDIVKLWTKILFGAFVITCVLLAFQVKRTSRGDFGGGRDVPRSILSDEAQREVDSNPIQFGEPVNEFESRRQPEGQPQMELRVSEDGVIVIE
jgi:preprotein translocase subunit SecG